MDVEVDFLIESILETQYPIESSNSWQRPMGHKNTKELKRKGIVEPSYEEDKELRKVMLSYKETMVENKMLRVMLTNTSTIESAAIRQWFL